MIMAGLSVPREGCVGTGDRYGGRIHSGIVAVVRCLELLLMTG